MKHPTVCLLCCFALALADSALAVTNLLANRGFEDTDEPADGVFGDGWGAFGAADFNAFFGANGHASLFGDDAFNVGGVFQLRIPATPGATYQFDLLDTRIESNWDANLEYGIEFYEADDTTKVSESFLTADTAARLALPNVDGGGAVNGAVFSMQTTAPAGAAFARPVVKFDNVNFNYIGGETQQANTFIFDSFLSEIPTLGGELLKNPGFEDIDGDGNLGNTWSSFGAADFNDFFSGGGDPNGHASLFSDTPGNFGGIYQSAILGEPGTEFEFALTDVRIEANFDADLEFGLEYYADDDFTKIGDALVEIDTTTTGDGLSFVMQGTVPAGTRFVRPIVQFDNVVSTATEQESVFIFGSSLVELPAATDDADFDQDGDVDGDDLLAWQRGAGGSGGLAMGDANGSGFVDGTDLAIWQSQYGSTAALAVSSIPEPTGSLLLLIGVFSLSFVDRRRSA
ncbi:MAG: hypothetical protein AAGD11_07365 [Planctomycetota bacterium]